MRGGRGELARRGNLPRDVCYTDVLGGCRTHCLHSRQHSAGFVVLVRVGRPDVPLSMEGAATQMTDLHILVCPWPGCAHKWEARLERKQKDRVCVRCGGTWTVGEGRKRILKDPPRKATPCKSKYEDWG